MQMSVWQILSITHCAVFPPREGLGQSLVAVAMPYYTCFCPTVQQ